MDLGGAPTTDDDDEDDECETLFNEIVEMQSEWEAAGGEDAVRLGHPSAAHHKTFKELLSKYGRYDNELCEDGNDDSDHPRIDEALHEKRKMREQRRLGRINARWAADIGGGRIPMSSMLRHRIEGAP